MRESNRVESGKDEQWKRVVSNLHPKPRALPNRRFRVLFRAQILQPNVHVRAKSMDQRLLAILAPLRANLHRSSSFRPTNHAKPGKVPFVSVTRRMELPNGRF